MIYYILTIPFRTIATMLAMVFLPLLILLEAVNGYDNVSKTIKTIFYNIWEV